jgi:hypothetical protein
MPAQMPALARKHAKAAGEGDNRFLDFLLVKMTVAEWELM